LQAFDTLLPGGRAGAEKTEMGIGEKEMKTLIKINPNKIVRIIVISLILFFISSYLYLIAQNIILTNQVLFQQLQIKYMESLIDQQTDFKIQQYIQTINAGLPECAVKYISRCILTAPGKTN
jgi:hypothetical protein